MGYILVIIAVIVVVPLAFCFRAQPPSDWARQGILDQSR